MRVLHTKWETFISFFSLFFACWKKYKYIYLPLRFIYKHLIAKLLFLSLKSKYQLIKNKSGFLFFLGVSHYKWLHFKISVLKHIANFNTQQNTFLSVCDNYIYSLPFWFINLHLYKVINKPDNFSESYIYFIFWTFY